MVMWWFLIAEGMTAVFEEPPGFIAKDEKLCKVKGVDGVKAYLGSLDVTLLWESKRVEYDHTEV